MKKQEIFDAVVEHFKTQKVAAVGLMPNGRNMACVYRAPDGKKCAVGALLPDEMYNPTMENKTIYQMTVDKYKLPSYFRSEEHLLSELQAIHDQTYSDSNPVLNGDLLTVITATELRELAEDNGLNADKVDWA